MSVPAGAGRPRIVAVAPNPTLDASASCEQVVRMRKLRCHDARRDPGGGGVNVARAARFLGEDARAVAAAGGETGEMLKRLLAAEGVPVSVVPLAGETRENFTVFEESTGAQYRFGLPGPVMTAEEAAELLAAAETAAPAGGYLVGSGSLPPGAPPDLYARMAAGAARAGARFVLDTSGEALRCALDAGGVHLVKPNFRELGERNGGELADERDAAEAAERLVASGAAEIVLLSLGAGGALLADSSGTVRIASPDVPVHSRIGAGDCALAGMLVGLVRGWEPARAARYAVAAGAAAVMSRGTGLCRKDRADELFACIEDESCDWAQTAGNKPREAYE